MSLFAQRRPRITLLCVLPLLASPVLVAQMAFSDDFETEQIDSFWTVQEQNGNLSRSSEQVRQGAHSLRLQSSGSASTQRTVALSHKFPFQLKGSVSIYFFDSTPGRETLYQKLQLVNSLTNVNAEIGTQDYDGLCYTAAITSPSGVLGPNSGCGRYREISTSLPRTFGWHLFRITFGAASLSLQIDDTQVYTLPGDYFFDTISLSITGPSWRSGNTVYFDDFRFNQIPANLSILTSRDLPTGTVSSQYSVALRASGGAPPYTWTIRAGQLPPGISLNSTSGTLQGLPTSQEYFVFTISVTDSSQAHVSQEFKLGFFRPGLRNTTGSFPFGYVGRYYRQPLTAVAGEPPYSWFVSRGELPPGLFINPVTNTIEGIPRVRGISNFGLRVIDRVGQSEDAVGFGFWTDLPPVSQLEFSGLSVTVPPAHMQRINLTMPIPYPVDLSAAAEVSFDSDILSASGDPEVKFADGGRVTQLSLPTRSDGRPSLSSDLMINTGTVAGTITCTISNIAAGDVDLTPVPPPRVQFRIPPQPPVITSVNLLQKSAQSLVIEIEGYVTTRQLLSAKFRFEVSNRNTTIGDVIVPLTALSSEWFGSERSAGFGGRFRYMQRFSLQDKPNVINVITTLEGDRGTSVPASLAVQD